MMVKKSVIAALSASAAAVFLAVPANAQPGDNPCTLAVSFICQFVPIAPELEGDVDLTQQLPPVDPNAPMPIADPCAAGCI
jgi:hypothetical protein